MNRQQAMRVSPALLRLAGLVMLLALVAHAAGLLWPGAGEPFTFTTLRGEPVQMFGRGLYRYDSLFTGAANLATDGVTLFLGLPLLLATTLWYRRGVLRGGMLLCGSLTYFLYVAASYALGAAAYNALFLVYVAYFSATFYALILALLSFTPAPLAAHFAPSMPRRSPAIFMFASGLVTLIVWIIVPLTALLQGTPPERMDAYSTLFTHALDMGVIVPATIIAGWLIWRNNSLGYLIAISLLVLEAMLAPLIAAQTISQLNAGVTFPPGQVVGPIGGFFTIALLALWFIIAILRNVRPSAAPEVAEVLAGTQGA